MNTRVHVAIATAAVLVAAADDAPAAPAATVRGLVVDASTGRPIEGALIQVAAESAETDAHGSFAVKAVVGDQLTIFAEGYEVALVAVESNGAPLRIELVTDAAQARSEVIEVEGKAPDLAGSAAYRLDRRDVRAVAGAGNDVLRAAQALPGVARVPFGLGGLVLRGVSPSGTSVYLDGIEVPSAFHVAAGTSFFPSTLLDTMTIVPGGGDAEWGRNVGGVVDLRSRAPRRDRWRQIGELNLMDTAAVVEGPTPLGGAIEIGVRRSHIDTVLGETSVANNRLVPRYRDAQLRWDFPIGAGTGGVLAFASGDHLVAPQSDLRSASYRLAVPYRRAWGRTRISTVPWIGFDMLGVDGYEPETFEGHVERRATPSGLRLDVLRDTTWGHVAAGLDGRFERARYEYRTNQWGTVPYSTTHGDAGGWAEARLRIEGGRLNVRPGVRVDHFGSSGEWTVDPRVMFSHELGRVVLREALGVHHRPPPTGLGDDALVASRSFHGTVAAEVDLPHQVSARVAVFSVFLDHLAVSVREDDNMLLSSSPGGGLGAASREAIDDQLGALTYRESVGRGRAHGVELSARWEGASSVAWVSYTISRSERTFDPRRDPLSYPYVLDQTHNVSFVVSTNVSNWTLGARFQIATGNPYTPFLGLVLDPSHGEFDRVYGSPNSSRLPTYVDLDIKVERVWRRRWGTLAAYLDLQNATNASLVEDVYVDFDREVPVRGLPLFPSVGLSVRTNE